MEIKRKLAITVSALLLVAGHLLPAAADSSSAPSASLVTCVNLQSGKERISKSGDCLASQALAKWRLVQSDTALATGSNSKQIIVCSNLENSTSQYRLIRANCPKHQVRSIYSRSTLLPATPVIANVVAYSDQSASISLAQNPAINPDAPVAYYTITSSKGTTQRVRLLRDLTLVISGLQALTAYTFTVTATNADGTTSLSDPSQSVTTKAYIPPKPIDVTPPAAQVSFISAETASVTIPVGATSVAVSSSALGNPSLSFSSQGAAITATIQSVANPAGGSSTPFTVSGSTKIVDISVSGLTGSATVCLDASPTAKLWHFVGGVWVDITTSNTGSQVCGVTSSFSPFTSGDELPAPEFSLSVSTLTANVESSISNVLAIKNSHSQVVTYSVSPTLPDGLSINSSTGTISGTPSATLDATDYTITATNAALGTATQILNLTVGAALSCSEGGACTLGQTGPGGGRVFYVSVAGFNCGPEFSSTGSPTGGLCHYLEMQNNDLGQKAIANNSGDHWPADTSNEIGSGFKNTLDQMLVLSGSSVNGETGNYALPATRQTFGGKSDWYLPSVNELVAAITYAASSSSPLPNRSYWSSSRVRRNYAGLVRTSPGGGGGDSWQYDSTWYVLAIRAF
jgi:hypothetical protein